MVDWYPTLCKLAGASLDQKHPVDGLDIWPVLTQGAKSPHQSIPLIGSRDGQYAIRVGDWKLLINPAEFKSQAKSEPVELYNLAQDIGEKNNLAASQPARVREMKARLDAIVANPAKPEFFTPKQGGNGKKKGGSEEGE